MSNSLMTPWTVVLQAYLSMGFPRQEYWSGLPFLSPGHLLDPGIKVGSSALQVDSSPPSQSWYSVVVVQSLSCVQLFATPWTAACQASLSFTVSWSLLKLMSIESVMPSNHLSQHQVFCYSSPKGLRQVIFCFVPCCILSILNSVWDIVGSQ